MVSDLLFEEAADAVVSGDANRLGRLIEQHPELVTARSAREHGATLLHYTAANGVEDSRQKTPPNVVAIARMLLDAGADVNAECNAYGGGATTLGLAATSAHPEKAGVQLELLDLLLAHDASIDGPDGGSAVNGCLRNGRKQAAEFLAGRGARLDFEGAAGLGRLDRVRELLPGASSDDTKYGFQWACEYGRKAVVEYLLERGAEVGTGLHWAALTGQVEVVRLLLERGARLDVQDERYGATPLGWAMYGRNTGQVNPDRANETIGMFVAAGAEL